MYSTKLVNLRRGNRYFVVDRKCRYKDLRSISFCDLLMGLTFSVNRIYAECYPNVIFFLEENEQKSILLFMSCSKKKS